MIDQEHKLLLSLVREAITGEPAALPGTADWERLITLAQEHVLGAMVCDVLQRHPEAPASVVQALSGDYRYAIFRDTQMEHWRSLVGNALASANIPHIFLRGICLKHDYPIPAMRTMTDIDMLVRREDLSQIRAAMLALGATAKDGDGNHNNYMLPGNVEVECHPMLIHGGSPIAAGINPGWQYAEKTQTAEHVLSEEGFYLNIMCHLAEHFAGGGVGVRFVADIWICRNRRKTQPDRSFVEKELRRFGLLEFARNIEALAEAWFGSGETTAILEEIGEYILTSGSHGKADRALLNAASLSEGGSGFSALLKKFYYPRQDLEVRFPWVRGRPWLLPVAWLVRLFRAVFRHRKQAASWGKNVFQTSREDVEEQRENLRRYGISAKGKKKKETESSYEAES